jgi:hypothetical protein
MRLRRTMTIRMRISIISIIGVRIIRKIIKEGISEVVAKVVVRGGGTAALISNHLWREAPLFKLLCSVVDEEAVLASGAQLHDTDLAVARVVEALKLLNGPLEPLHEKDAGSEAVGNNDKVGLGGVVLAEALHVDVAPERFQEA